MFLILLCVAIGNFLILHSTLLMISFVNLLFLKVGREKLPVVSKTEHFWE